MSAPAATYALLSVEELPPDEAVGRLLERAVELGAGELFFASQPDHIDVVVRHLGVFRPLSTLPLDLGRHCLGFLKAASAMDVAEHRHPQAGRWFYELPDGGRVDLRVSTLPTLHGEDWSLRLLTHDDRMLALEEVGVIRKELNDLLAMLNSPSGLLLLTGPNGSGKTTTVYTFLRYLNNGERKINTIEDPVEYELPGVRQSQVNEEIGLTYPELLRGVLRQAPDVLLIGEISDPVTAATAVHAANSGILVLATLHSPTVMAGLEGLRAWGVHPHFLANALLGVVAQRLIRTLCPRCRVPVPLEQAPPIFEQVKSWLGPEEGAMLYDSAGCPACHQTGFASQTGVFEVLRLTPAVRRLIAEDRPAEEVRAKAVEEGLVELRRAALLKVARGETTVGEVLRSMSLESLGVEA